MALPSISPFARTACDDDDIHLFSPARPSPLTAHWLHLRRDHHEPIPSSHLSTQPTNHLFFIQLNYNMRMRTRSLSFLIFQSPAHRLHHSFLHFALLTHPPPLPPSPPSSFCNKPLQFNVPS
ncbi:hypothetical protein B0F90DRAFT_698614 [Multifurca ochricompacta]|uniref:Uncharacterized protein n=1 Tax=Multifurca ochricompacta TaxID=376703 RepID=A0AAD4QIP8_9AGAM|nr:hypothetical protein B0F90DRAFT_698614 [Multifurca ochricompacta]